MNKFKLGQSITFNQVLERKYIEAHKRNPPDVPNKQWLCKSHKKTEGIVIGIRTISDSHVSYYEDHIECDNVNHQKALLVAYHIKRKPVFVPYEEYLIEFEFDRFNPNRHRRGIEAVTMLVYVDGEKDHLLWMSKRDIKNNIREWGESPEFQKALEAYNATDN